MISSTICLLGQLLQPGWLALYAKTNQKNLSSISIIEQTKIHKFPIIEYKFQLKVICVYLRKVFLCSICIFILSNETDTQADILINLRNFYEYFCWQKATVLAKQPSAYNKLAKIDSF